MIKKEVFSVRYGYCVNMIAEDCYGVGYTYIPLLKKWGFDYVDLPMAQLMEMDDSTFQDCVLAPLKDVGLPCVCTNNLFPAGIRLTGPDADPNAAIDYCKRAFPRAAALGARRAVFGSSGARNIPFGWPYADAQRQLTELLLQLSPLAEAYGITFVIEPLNRSESNIITSIAEGVRICKTAASPRVKMLVDYYHMALCGESAADAAKTCGTLQHVHIARPLGRGLPVYGDGEDYRLFFDVLHTIGYDGEISIEAYAPDTNRASISASLEYLRSCAEEKAQ